MKTHRSGGGESCVFATNPLLVAETGVRKRRIRCSILPYKSGVGNSLLAFACVRKRPKPTASRGLAMKMHRSGGGEYRRMLCLGY